MSFSAEHIVVPADGDRIEFNAGALSVPDRPIVPFIEGDGMGPDIWAAAVRVFDAGVAAAYGDARSIRWMEIYAGEKAKRITGDWLPEETVEAVREFAVAIKGPLTTPVGGGIRSLNVTMRKRLDLYACVRPSRWIQGTPSPVRDPAAMDVVIYRENTEDVYAGIEWAAGSPEGEKVRSFLNDEMGCSIREGSGIGVKPISEFGTKRLVRMCIVDALGAPLQGIPISFVVTNPENATVKYTEGAFREWGYELAREEFGDRTITETELWSAFDGKRPEGKLVIKDRIADAMFQQILLRPAEYDYIALPNLNGDYLSDACAAQVGGLGMAPGANIGDGVALFEATHGTAPKYAGLDKVNPTSLILSGVMMFDHMGWREAAEAIVDGITKAVGDKVVTYDLERQMDGATLARTSEFADQIIKNMGA